VLAISDPAYGNPTMDEATFAWEGRVRVFLLDNIPVADVLVSDVPGYAMLTGGADFSHFGWQVAFADVDADGSDELLVSSPLAQHEQGEVAAFSNAGADGSFCLILKSSHASLICSQGHSQAAPRTLASVCRWLCSADPMAASRWLSRRRARTLATLPWLAQSPSSSSSRRRRLTGSSLHKKKYTDI
jgi:hypothetical protein